MPVTFPRIEPGWVWLVGAGPGDPGLLTLHGLNALQSADVIVYDALVDPTVLALAAPEVERIHAGKRGGKPSPKQHDISARLVSLAREGRRVLRLKGGDPFVFGRGGEEALALVEAGVPFRVVPGVTSGIGGLAYAGIPATHRDVNSAVTFITGHALTGEVPDDLDWHAVARGAPVLVFYMAIKHLGEIVARLLEAGRRPDDAVALISKATTEDQHVTVTRLDRAVSESRGVAPPAIVVVGEVVRLRPALDWVGAMAGRTLEVDPLGTRQQDEVV